MRKTVAASGYSGSAASAQLALAGSSSRCSLDAENALTWCGLIERRSTVDVRGSPGAQAQMRAAHHQPSMGLVMVV